MALMTGNDGKVQVAAVELPSRTWTLTEEASEKETTNSTTAANARDFLADRAGGSFSFEAYVDDATATLGVGGSSAAMIFDAKQGTTDKSWTFNGVILSKEIITNIAGGDAVLARYSGRVSGAITEIQLT